MVKCSFYSIVLLICLLVGSSVQVNGAELENIEVWILSKQVTQIEQAITLLTQDLEEDPNDGQTLWIMAKAHLYLGDQIEDHKLVTFENGKVYADRAVELLPNSPDSHYWQSALIGRIGQTRGILSSLFMVRPMKDALDRVLELDENYAAAYWVLSQLYQEAPGFPLSIGNKKLALENASKAVELDFSNVEYHLQLAEALEHNGGTQEAIEVLEKLLKMPAIKQEPEIKVEAESLLAKLSR